MTARPSIHGGHHRGRWNPTTKTWRGGADPIPFDVFLSPAALMGAVLPGVRLEEISLGLNGGVLYLPSREGPPLETGEEVRISFAFAEPSPSHFDWIAFRAHIVDGLNADDFRHTEPWESSPWSGGANTEGTAGSFTLAPIGGNWNGSFYGFAGVSADDSDVVHFATPGLAIDDDEQFGWDIPGVGHIGYLFHDFTTSEAGNITISFASGAGPAKAVGYVRCTRDSAVTVGTMVGETTGSQTAQQVISLTADVPSGSGLIVVTASQGPAGFDPSDATKRPVVDIESRESPGSLIPVFKNGTQLYPIVRDIGGLGQPAGDIDGGSA